MSFTIIPKVGNVPDDLSKRGVTDMPNVPTIGADALKREFDAPAKECVAPAVNRLIGELEASTAAESIGAAAPSGYAGTTVQGVVNSVAGQLTTLASQIGPAITDAHTHSNKALLDTYDQTNEDISDAVSKAHAHSNKSLLDTYEQTESDLADAVTKKHTHSNKTLLDSYDQTNSDITDAITKKHTHSNKALLDTYTQTESDLSDAVSKKHTHSNKTVLDKFGEDSSGKPTYDGDPIGGGGSGNVNNAYKIIKVGTTNITASGEDTFEIKAGSNVTLTPDASTKSVTINATGGGQSSGDMLASDYDSDYDVKNAGGIKAYVSSQALTGEKGVIVSNGKVKANLKDETQSALQSATIQSAQNRQYAVNLDSNGNLSVNVPWVNTEYSAATTSADGLMSSTDKTKLNGLPSSVPTTDQTYDATSTNPQAGVAVASAVSGKADKTTAFLTTDTAETTIADADTIPFYDDSDSSKKKSTWQNIKSKLKAYFDTLYNLYTLPTASTTTLGGVKPDGTSTFVDPTTGVLTSTGGGSSVSVEHTGTASSTAFRKQTITVNGTAYTIDGTKYMEASTVLSTTVDVSIDFANQEILTTSEVRVFTTKYGLSPKSINMSTAGHCIVTFAKASAAESISVRLYVK